MTIGGLHHGYQPDSGRPTGVWDDIRRWFIDDMSSSEEAWLKGTGQHDMPWETGCPDATFSFYAKDRLPNHVVEKYDKFTDFVGVFYKWLECDQQLGVLSKLKDVDETPDVFLKLFKDTYAKGLPDTTFRDPHDWQPPPIDGEDDPWIKMWDVLDPSDSKIQVRNFLKYARDFYQLKSIEEAYDFFFSMFYNANVSIDYPKIYLHKCSEGNFRGITAGYLGATTDPCYHWGDSNTTTPKYKNFPSCMCDPERDSDCEDPYQNCIPVNFPDYGPTGPCYFNSDGHLCWGHGGSFDDKGNMTYPPCDNCGIREKAFRARRARADGRFGGASPISENDENVAKSVICSGCAPGSPCGMYYHNDFGLISGFSRIHDNKIWQNYSYLLDSDLGWDVYKDWVKNILHPAGMYFVGNYTVHDDFPQPGTTGEVIPMETPVIGHYTPYRFSTNQNLKNNTNSTDLYPCGWNPYVADAGISYTSQHIQDTSGLWYKHEAGTTAHQPAELPLGICGGTGGLDAAEYGQTFFRIFHHPNSWAASIPTGTQFKDISLGSFIYLTGINIGDVSPNNPAGSSAGCGF